jgi:hypothetical protein
MAGFRSTKSGYVSIFLDEMFLSAATSGEQLQRPLDRALLMRYETNAAQAPSMNSASASSTFAGRAGSDAAPVAGMLRVVVGPKAQM